MTHPYLLKIASKTDFVVSNKYQQNLDEFCMRLHELYTKDNRELYNYFNSKTNQDVNKIKILINYFRPTINRYLNSNVKIFSYNHTHDTDYEKFDELSTDDVYNLIHNLSEKDKEHVIDYCLGVLEKDDDLRQWIPSLLIFDTKNMKILPKNTWLIHFSKNARAIYKSGFKYGVSDKSLLAYTELFDNDDDIKNKQGWNFAFKADDLKDLNDYISRYGKDALMFQSSGVEVTHEDGDENEIIFQGKYIKPEDMVYLKLHRDNWLVLSRKKKILFSSHDL